jgi:hypothetical protein
VKLCLTLFKPVCAGSRVVCLADGIKAPKEGKLMPAVKSLFTIFGPDLPWSSR